MTKLIKIFLFWIFCYSGFSQDKDLKDKIGNRSNFTEIMEIVNDHYKKKPNVSAEKKWARWAWYNRNRLDEKGNVIDVKLKQRQAFAELQRKIGKNKRGSVGNWTFEGPSTSDGGGLARVDRLAFHPSNANIIYAGTPGGGLFKTINGGNSWVAKTDNLPSTAVSGIVVSHSNPDKIFILTGSGDDSGGGFVSFFGYRNSGFGVAVSNNGGDDWSYCAPFPDPDNPNNNLTSCSGYKLVQHPTDANILFAATTNGLFKTVNAGSSWTVIYDQAVTDIEFGPADNNVIMFTPKGGVEPRISNDLGESYTNVPLNSINILRREIDVTADDPNIFYIFEGRNYESPDCDTLNILNNYIKKYNYLSGQIITAQGDENMLFSSCCDGNNGRNQVTYDLALAIHPLNKNIVFAGGIKMWKSTNNGVNFSIIHPSCSNGSSGYIHDDIHHIIFNPLNNYVYAATDGGISMSIDQGYTWIDISDGIDASQIYHLETTTYQGTIHQMIGLQDNGIKVKSGNSDWSHKAVADGFDAKYTDDLNGYSTMNKKTYRFTNNGSNFNSFFKGGYFSPLGVHNILPNFLLFSDSDSTYVTADYGNSISISKITPSMHEIESCPSNTNRFYAAGGNSAYSANGDFYRSNDLGVSWTLLDSYNIRLSDIDVSPTNSNTVWRTHAQFDYTERVMTSFDAGVTWVDKTYNLPGIPMNAIEISSNGDAYVGSDLGMFYLANGLTEWIPFDNGLPIVPVTDIEIEGANLYISTFGRGVWKSDLYSTCSSDYFLTGDVSGHKIFEASNIINTQQEIRGGLNSKVLYKADNYIKFLPGFKSGKGGRIRAYESACGDYIE